MLAEKQYEIVTKAQTLEPNWLIWILTLLLTNHKILEELLNFFGTHFPPL